MIDPRAPRPAEPRRAAPRGRTRRTGHRSARSPQDAERRSALEAVAAEAADQHVPAGEAAFAFACYDDGYLALAINGVVERRSGERLAGIFRDVRTLGRHELDIELTGLVRSSTSLLQFLGHLRLQQVASCGRLQLHHPPADLVTALGEAYPDELTIHRARPPVRAL